MSYSEPFRNFLRRSANDFVRELLDEVLAVCCKDFLVAQNRFMSIQASQPMEFSSDAFEVVSPGGAEFCEMKFIL